MRDQVESSLALPASWTSCPLAKLSDVFTDGNWIETKDQAPAGIRLVQTGNVGTGEFKDRRDKARFVDERTFERLNCFEVYPEDILVSRLPDPVGRACMVPDLGERMITAVDCSIVRPNVQAVDPGYLVYYTQTGEYLRSVDERCTGTTRRRISRKNLGQVPIPLPPLEEQKRIVARLDQAFAALDRARANAEANLADADALVGSTLASAFLASDADTLSLGEICRFEGGSQPPKSQFVAFPRDGYIRLLQIRDFKSDDRAVYIPDDGKRRRCKQEDIMIGRYGASVGQIHRGKAGTYNVALIKATPDDTILERDYFFYYLRSDLFQKPLMERSSRGAQNGFNKGDISDFPVPVPPKPMQKAIVERLSGIAQKAEVLRNIYEDKLTDIADLRQSLLQKAFSGQLT